MAPKRKQLKLLDGGQATDAPTPQARLVEAFLRAYRARTSDQYVIPKLLRPRVYMEAAELVATIGEDEAIKRVKLYVGDKAVRAPSLRTFMFEAHNRYSVGLLPERTPDEINLDREVIVGRREDIELELRWYPGHRSEWLDLIRLDTSCWHVKRECWMKVDSHHTSVPMRERFGSKPWSDMQSFRWAMAFWSRLEDVERLVLPHEARMAGYQRDIDEAIERLKEDSKRRQARDRKRGR